MRLIYIYESRRKVHAAFMMGIHFVKEEEVKYICVIILRVNTKGLG